MLARQLYVFDSLIAHSAVVLSESTSLSVKISICDALSLRDLFNDILSECVTP